MSMDKIGGPEFTGAGEGPLPPLGRKSKLIRGVSDLRRNSQSVLILCYHGVSKSDEHAWNPRLYIEAEVFRRRLKTIREFGYQVLPLASALQQMRERALTAPTAVITFDDGWHDFHQVGLPILRTFDYPATVYQTTYYAEYNRPVFDPACAYLLWKATGRVIRFGGVNGKAAELDLTQPGAVERSRQDLLEEAKRMEWSAEQKDGFLQRLAEGVGVDYNALLSSRTLHLMNRAEIGEVAKARVDVQLHTHRHRLPLLKPQFLSELDENGEWIEAATGKQARQFCYPNGVYRPEFMGWLRDAGIHSATTCEPGRASHRSEPLLLPRLTDSNTVSQTKFESWLAGFGLIAPACKRVLRSVFASGASSQSCLETASAKVAEASASAKEVRTEA